MRNLILFSLLIVVGGCSSTVHRNVWFEDDGYIVRKDPPVESDLPQAGESFASVRYAARVVAKRSFGGELTMGVIVKDYPEAIEPEPFDLDVTIRVDGEPGTWISGVQLGRSFRPLNVEEGTGVLFRFHAFDWSGEELQSWTKTHLMGEPDKPYIEADVYVEYYIVGREYVEGKDWYYVYQFRSRFRSEHPDWEVQPSKFDFATRRGMAIKLPVFPGSDPD